MYSQLNFKIDQATITQLINQLGDLLSSHNLVLDSRQVKPRDIFCAYAGVHVNGCQYIESAIKQGAIFILWDDADHDWSNIMAETPNLKVPNLTQYIGILSAHSCGYPSNKQHVIGVTGTNGKTSITYWLNQVFEQLGEKTGIIGTTGYGIYPRLVNNGMTTPDPITIEHILLEFKQQSVAIIALEVSSHALVQGRVNGIQFESAIFTNLTQDHLDYHHTMENYFRAKKELFYWHGIKQIIINTDDTYGKLLHQNVLLDRLPAQVISYGVDSGDVRASDIKISLAGTSFKLLYHYEHVNITTKNILGRFNIYNLLAVAAYLILYGLDLDKIKDIITNLKPVKGRMEVLNQTNSPLVVIDYAHTPDALLNVLTTLNEVEKKGRLICIFGCGGDRDQSKRSQMGDIAFNHADFCFVTSDNPRSEDPIAIIEQIIEPLALISKKQPKQHILNNSYKIQPDRKQAIKEAIELASCDDIILIAGKGHEEYQEIKGKKYHFSDYEIATEFLIELNQ